jgi:hypothetical protein
MWPALSATELAEINDRAAKVAENGEIERHDIYIKRYGINQTRLVYGNAIILLGCAFRDGGLSFASTEDALHALLGVKKRPPKPKKKSA